MNGSLANIQINKMKSMQRVATDSRSQQSPGLTSNPSFSNSINNKALDIYHVNGKVTSTNGHGAASNNNHNLQGISEYNNGINGSSPLQVPQNGRHLDQNGRNGTHHFQVNGQNLNTVDISNPQNDKVEISDDSPNVTPYTNIHEDSIIIVTKKYTDSAKGSISMTNDEVS